MDTRTATRTEPSPVRRVALVIGAGLAAAAVWAGISIAGGTGGSGGAASGGSGPAATSDASGSSFVQQDDGGDGDGRNCPEKDGGSNSGGAADTDV